MLQLRHPHVVQLVGACLLDPGLPMLAFEYLDGGSLSHYIHDVVRSRLDHGSFFSIARDVALALNYLHKRPRPIVHLDVKSANILLDAYLRAKVADLGLAKVMGASQPLEGHKMVKIELSGPRGTPAWMAPEMLQDEVVSISPATDVYGLGLILWEMKAGVAPYANMNLNEVCTAIKLGQRPEVPQDLSPDIKCLISQCWNQDPESRPRCEEVLAKLNQMSFPDHWKALLGSRSQMDTATPFSDDPDPYDDPDDLEPRPNFLSRSLSAPIPPPPPPPPPQIAIKREPKVHKVYEVKPGFQVTTSELRSQLTRLKKVTIKEETTSGGSTAFENDLASLLKKVIVQRRESGWCESSSNASSGRVSRNNGKMEMVSWSGDDF